jgi:hypothetical protein
VIRDIGTITAGIANSSDNYALGTLNFLNVNAVIAGGSAITTKSPTLTLDGSGSTGGNLSYQWSGGGTPGLAFQSPTSPITTVFIGMGPGTYVAMLKVTNNDLGETSTAVVVVTYKP